MKKRLFLILLIAVFITAFAYSQKITITNPHSGSKWYKGQTYTITWTKSGVMDAKVKIRLYQGGSKVLGITDKTDNDGSFTWKVPDNLPDGNYVIRVRTVDNNVFDDSDMFVITGEASITVKEPGARAQWVAGKTYTIKWEKKGKMNPYVKIRLYRGNEKVLNITDSTPNNGHYDWKIPTNLQTCLWCYNIRVRTVDNHVFDDSYAFGISPASDSNKFGDVSKYVDLNKKRVIGSLIFPINVISPTGGKWKEGSTMRIKWEGKSGEEFAIYLVSFDKKDVEKVIKVGVIELLPFGSKAKYFTYNWKIPNKLFGDITKYIGDHRIKIVRKKDGAVGYSKPFHIFASIKTQTYKIYARTTNTYHWKNKKKSSIIGGAPFVLGFKYDDPGNGKLRVGYANTYKEDSITYNYYGEVYRAHAFFNVSKLKGKGLITKATLHYHHYKGNSCGLRIYRVTKPFSNLFNASIELIENPQGDWSSLVRKWVRTPSSNHGIIFTGMNESFSHNNDKCVDYYDNVYLEVTVIGR